MGKLYVLFISILALMFLLPACSSTAPGNLSTTVVSGDVLILASSVSGGSSSVEAQAAIALGYTVEVVDATGWAAKTAAEFSQYRAIILGDPTCLANPATIAAAANNANIWGPRINGNVVIIGTDPVFHQSQGGAALTQKGVAFALAEAGKTGAYITLSCYYDGTAPGTTVPALSNLGSTPFKVGPTGSCFNDAYIVASHPSLNGLTSANLSNWSCSVHEVFTSWPPEYEVLAIAKNLGSGYTAPDGTKGTPYILARGKSLGVVSDIKLEPLDATNPVGTSHTVTATVTNDSGGTVTPVVGTTVTFKVLSGPHTGVTGTATTNASGKASFSYTGTAVGTDVIRATFVDSSGVTQTSNAVQKVWVAGTGDTTKPICRVDSITAGPPATLNVFVQDAGSGLAAINVKIAQNVTPVIPAFSSGSKTSLIVKGIKINQTQKSRLELEVKDVAGNITLCDPVIVNLKIDEGNTWGRTSVNLTDIPDVEGQIRIDNGVPGASVVRIKVNDGDTRAINLAPGAITEHDVSADMGRGSNSASIVMHGAPGSSAIVMFHDGSASVSVIGASSLKRLNANLNLDWY
jgi:hypothetical protein